MKLFPICLLAAGVFVLQGCALGASQPSPSQVAAAPSCSIDAEGLNALTTQKQVTACFGKSRVTTRNDDGRHTALYRFDGGHIIVFLFDKRGSVIRYRAYQDEMAR